MKHVRQYAAFVILAALLSACAQLGIPTADTFNERLAVAYSSVTQIRVTATSLLKAKQLTADDGQSVLTATDAARAGLDVARSLSKTDLKAADNRLTAARTALTALSTYLATKGAQ